MTARGKMQPVVMRALTVMLVASFMLTVVSLAWPELASAEHYCYWQDGGRTNVHCGGRCGAWAWYYGCWDKVKIKTCCDAYHCWYAGTSYQPQCGCPC